MYLCSLLYDVYTQSLRFGCSHCACAQTIRIIIIRTWVSDTRSIEVNSSSGRRSEMMASLLGNSIRSAVRSSRRSVPILRGRSRLPIRRGASSQSSGGEGSSFNKGIIAVGVGIAGVTLYTVSSLSCLCNSLRASSGTLVQVAIRTCEYLTFYVLNINLLSS